MGTFARVPRSILTAGAIVAVALAIGRHEPAHAQSRATILAVTSDADRRAWDGTIDAMTRTGELERRREDADFLLPGRTHERFAQRYKGVPVFGGDVTRQTNAGSTVSLFGTIYNDIDMAVDPALTVDAALAVVKRESGVDLGATRAPQLMILPLDGQYRLVYHAKTFSDLGAFEYFIDANSGAVVRRLDAAQRQTAKIGTGTGVLGDQKKLSVNQSGGTYLADDELRPPFLFTFDMRGNLTRMNFILNGAINPSLSDVASSSNNVWTDQAVVDAHAYAGYVYDYYYKRFGRRGLDNQNLEMWSFVHPVIRSQAPSVPSSVLNEFYVNAFYAGDGIMVYGEGIPANLTLGGQHFDYFSGALDVVGHELTHGVTDYSSGLIYQFESGALNESFSDMMGTSIEFYYQPAGSGPLRADYIMGEDIATPGGFRSMSNPAAYGQPDHYSRRLVVTGPPTDDNDDGGVHTNSGIGNQFYYLAIEGGVNRTSGLTVQGVGAANREQIEKVVYRAFTQMMPANATYSVARAATIQSARDLYGAGSAAERAVTQSWTAVGVN